MKTKTEHQLRIRALRANGEFATPVTYPIGCVHKTVSPTKIEIFHPEDRNPKWTPPDEDDDGHDEPKYLMAYAEFSCQHGFFVEYVDAETTDPKEVSEDRVVVRYDDAITNGVFVRQGAPGKLPTPVSLTLATDFKTVSAAYYYMKQFTNSRWTILTGDTLRDTGYSSETVA